MSALCQNNNFRLGGQGRYRTNVLDYPSVNSLDPARHGDLDPFAGSGTTILAAERTGRVARVIELDPLYVDVAVRRWQKVTRISARHAGTGLAFAEMEARQDESADNATRRTVSRS
jgi:hypothetical protein